MKRSCSQFSTKICQGAIRLHNITDINLSNLDIVTYKQEVNFIFFVTGRGQYVAVYGSGSRSAAVLLPSFAINL